MYSMNLLFVLFVHSHSHSIHWNLSGPTYLLLLLFIRNEFDLIYELNSIRKHFSLWSIIHTRFQSHAFHCYINWMHLWWFICILNSVSTIYVEFGMCVNKLKIQYNSSEMDDSFVAFFLLVNSVVVFIHSVENWFYRLNHPNRKVLFLYSYTVYGICSLEYTATDERWEK